MTKLMLSVLKSRKYCGQVKVISVLPERGQCHAVMTPPIALFAVCLAPIKLASSQKNVTDYILQQDSLNYVDKKQL